MPLCACGSKQLYQACCGRFIESNMSAPSPELLMRSRYTAYTLANIKYIQRTMKGKAAEGFDAEQAKLWARQAKWLDLEIKQVTPINELVGEGKVEFIARYLWDGKIQLLHELSRFIRTEGVWYYVDGVVFLDH